jgi:hypothetical protein
MGAEYEFRIAGYIEPGALSGVDGLTIVPGASDTIMRGELAGQSAVFAILARLHALGLTLLELRRTDPVGAGHGSRAPAAGPATAAGPAAAAAVPPAAAGPATAVPPTAAASATTAAAGPATAAAGPATATASAVSAANPPPAAEPSPAAEPPTGPGDAAGPPVDIPASVALMIGLMAGVTESAVAGLRQAGTAVRPLRQPAATIWRLLPGSEGVSRIAQERADVATARGKEEFAAGVSLAKNAWSAALDRIGEDPTIQRMVQQLADRVLDPILDSALPKVLDRLADEPERVRRILGVQSLGMTEEVTDAIRERTAVADDQVERLANLLIRRRGRRGPGKPSPLPHEA